jgi:hypothetical protein
MDDASLDDFLDGGSDDPGAESGEKASGGSESPSAEADETADEEPSQTPSETADETADGEDAAVGDGTVATESDGVPPAESTFAWSSEPVACAACGEAVQRRWRGDGELVCRACKSW